MDSITWSAIAICSASAFCEKISRFVIDMNLHAQFFAQLRDVTGTTAMDVELTDGATVAELLEKLYAQAPSLGEGIKRFSSGRGRIVGRDHVLGLTNGLHHALCKAVSSSGERGHLPVLVGILADGGAFRQDAEKSEQDAIFLEATSTLRRRKSFDCGHRRGVKKFFVRMRASMRPRVGVSIIFFRQSRKAIRTERRSTRLEVVPGKELAFEWVTFAGDNLLGKNAPPYAHRKTQRHAATDLGRNFLRPSRRGANKTH